MPYLCLLYTNRFSLRLCNILQCRFKNSFILKKYFYLLIPIPIILLILVKNLDLFKKKYFYFAIILILFLLFFLIFNYNDTPFKINTFNRPPLYPLFMIFGGIYTFNTFIYFITLQIFISLVCIYMIYKILNKFIYNSKFVFLCICIRFNFDTICFNNVFVSRATILLIYNSIYLFYSRVSLLKQIYLFIFCFNCIFM